MPIFDFTETLNDYSDSEISENSKYEFLLGIVETSIRMCRVSFIIIHSCHLYALLILKKSVN